MHPNWKCLSTVPFNFKNFVREGNYNSTTDELTPKPIKSSFTIAGEETKSLYESLIAKEYPPSRNKRVIVKIKPKCENKIKLVKTDFHVNNFMRCASNNDVGSLKDMLKENHEKINIVDNFGWTALMCAAHANAEKVVETLLKMGADHSITDKSGHTAISLARKVGNKSIVDKISKYICCGNQTSDSVGKRNPSDFFCDSCKQCFRDCSMKEHETSIVHLLNKKQNSFGTVYGISMNNKGYQLMLKKGWDKETGLGPHGSGLKFPIKTVIRDGRTGLGISQPPARVSHSTPNAQLINRSNAVKKKNHVQHHLSDKRKEHRFRLMLS